MSKLKRDPAGYAIDCLEKRLCEIDRVIDCTNPLLPVAPANLLGGLSLGITWSISLNYMPIGAAIWGIFAAASTCGYYSLSNETVKIALLIDILGTLRIGEGSDQSSSVSETCRVLEDFQKETVDTCGKSPVNLKDILLSIRVANKQTLEDLGEIPAENQPHQLFSRFSIWTSQPEATAPLSLTLYILQ